MVPRHDAARYPPIPGALQADTGKRQRVDMALDPARGRTGGKKFEPFPMTTVTVNVKSLHEWACGTVLRRAGSLMTADRTPLPVAASRTPPGSPDILWMRCPRAAARGLEIGHLGVQRVRATPSEWKKNPGTGGRIEELAASTGELPGSFLPLRQEWHIGSQGKG